MRMKMVCDDRTLADVANEFLALKKAQKVRERTLNDYKKYIDKFLNQHPYTRYGIFCTLIIADRLLPINQQISSHFTIVL